MTSRATILKHHLKVTGKTIKRYKKIQTRLRNNLKKELKSAQKRKK